MRVQPDEASVEEKNMNVDKVTISIKNKIVQPFILLVRICAATTLPSTFSGRKLYISYVAEREARAGFAGALEPN